MPPKPSKRIALIAALAALNIALISALVRIAVTSSDSSANTATAQAVTGDMFYEDLPIGREEMLAYLREQGIGEDEVNARILKAYKAGRLPVGDKVWNDDRSAYAQVVGIPYVESDPTDTPSCGMYNGWCEIIVTLRNSDASTSRFISSDLYGYKPVAFLPDGSLIISGGTGDGPGYAMSIQQVSAESGNVINSLVHEVWAGADEIISFEVDRADYELQFINDKDNSETNIFIDNPRGYYTADHFQKNMRFLATIRRTGIKKGFDIVPFDIDAKSYFLDPSKLLVTIDGVQHEFALTSSTARFVR